VDRASIYLWKKRALSALREALEPHKKGPKFKKNPESREIEKLRRKLEGFLKEKGEKIKGLRERLNPNKEEFKPIKYPYRRFEKVYKNGTYKRKPKGSFDKLKQNE